MVVRRICGGFRERVVRFENEAAGRLYGGIGDWRHCVNTSMGRFFRPDGAGRFFAGVTAIGGGHAVSHLSRKRAHRFACGIGCPAGG
jgi:hypothetical protein